MTLTKDPNSKRSQRRRNRSKNNKTGMTPFCGSRPQRRAERRLAIATAGYANAHDVTGSTKPGAIKHW